MNYQKIYEKLMIRAEDRELTGYFERHHVIPRCMGGTNNRENIVKLTPEEHFLAHVLLLKIYRNTQYRHALAKACNYMCSDFNGQRNSRKLYG